MPAEKPTRSPRSQPRLRKPPSRSTKTTAGYRKGNETRAHFLAVALKVFSRDGFAGATTRQIADEAGMSLPILSYYFGDKAGLYLACAEEIASSYELAMGPAIAEATLALQGPMAPAAARDHLTRILDGLVRLVSMCDGEGPAPWTLFVQRELANPGDAYALLYDRVWGPAFETQASLIARALGQRRVTAECRVRAMLLLADLSVFEYARPLFTRTFGSGRSLAAQRTIIKRLITEEIERLGRSKRLGRP